jgi:hypothetical protein
MPVSHVHQKIGGQPEFLPVCPLMNSHDLYRDYGAFVFGALGTLFVFIPAGGVPFGVIVLFGAGVFPDSDEFFWQPARASKPAMKQIVRIALMPLLLVRLNRDVVLDVFYALDTFRDVIGFGFLRIRLHKSVQLDLVAIDVHIDVVEFIFRIVAQRIAHLVLQRFIVNVLAGTAFVGIASAAGK